MEDCDMKIWLLVFFVLLIRQDALAEIILMKPGEVIEGQIIHKDENEVKVDTGVGVGVTYFPDDIESIDGKKKDNLDSERTTIAATERASNVFPKSITNGSMDDAQIFRERLSLVFYMLEDPKWRDEELFEVVRPLEKFPVEFPQSNYADDASVFIVMSTFAGAAIAKDQKGAERSIEMMRQIFKVYPQGEIEPFTLQLLVELGARQIQSFYIPYNLMIDYMQGFLSFEMGEFEQAIKSFSIIKNNLDLTIDPSGFLFNGGVYVPLAISYVKLANDRELNKLCGEIKEIFRDNRNFMEENDREELINLMNSLVSQTLLSGH